MSITRARTILSWLGAIALMAVAWPARAEVTLEPEHPVIGEPARITLVDGDAEAEASAGVEVAITYYPGSAVEKTVVIGATDEAGVLSWTPEHAGLATISAGSSSTTVGVRFEGLPVRGLVVFLFAGSLLFGAIFFGSRLILRGDYIDPTT